MKRAGVGKEGGGRGKLRWGKNERGEGEGGREVTSLATNCNII